jgi:hypothetical protein
MITACKHGSVRTIFLKDAPVTICNRCHSLVNAPGLIASFVYYHDTKQEEYEKKEAGKIKRLMSGMMKRAVNSRKPYNETAQFTRHRK